MNKRLYIILNSILMLGFNLTTYAHDEPVLKLDKTNVFADYQVQLICNTTAGVGEPQKCKISIYNPNEPDKSKATVILPNSEITIDSSNNKLSSTSSSSALDIAEKPFGAGLQKYRVSRDWLLRIELSEGGKQADISTFSPFVPNEK